MIRLHDQAVCVSLRLVEALGVERFALEILAHEIGHHVYAPGDLLDHGRMMVRVRRGLPTLEAHAPMVANLYLDLLINDRLHRQHGLNLAGVYQALDRGDGESRLWTLYMRTYEILWGLERGSLTGQRRVADAMEADARLAARIVRVHAGDWVRGSGRFAALCLPYLAEDAGDLSTIGRLLDAVRAGEGAEVPAGLVEAEDDEGEGLDEPGSQEGSGQHREPFEFGELLRSLGLELDAHEVAMRYYRERALPHLVRFPVRTRPESKEPLMEGTEPWEPGMPLEEVDWLSSLLASPRPVPGVTTLRRVWGTMDGRPPQREPVDLDLYVDCSGSMPNPKVEVSYLTLAGAIVTLSALRAGARVQATLWSGKNEFDTTGAFVRDEQRILRILTGYFGGGTAFPLHLLRETYRRRTERPVHILIVSDDGVDTMGAQDEQGNDGMALARRALEVGGAGGTMVLRLFGRAREQRFFQEAEEMGWNIFPIGSWDDLVGFARSFSRKHYEAR